MSLNPRLQDWQGRTAWLIGASTGIGRATASALHAAGARVIVSARQAPLLNEFVALHPGSHALPLDVMDLPALHAAAAEVGTLFDVSQFVLRHRLGMGKVKAQTVRRYQRTGLVDMFAQALTQHCV